VAGSGIPREGRGSGSERDDLARDAGIPASRRGAVLPGVRSDKRGTSAGATSGRQCVQEAPEAGGTTQRGRTQPPVFLSEAAALAADRVVLDGPEGRHAATVRRLGPGERVDLTDGAGLVAECVVTVARAGTLELSVLARRSEPPPDPVLVVVQALPKGEHGPLAVDLMTEGGVDVIVPWAAQRCVSRWQGERGDRSLARWRSAATQAAKQARRAWLPEVTGPVTTSELVRRVGSASLAVLLGPAGPVALSVLELPESGDILLIVGPEGGVSPAEDEMLTGAGAVGAHLGPAVLRTSSAGLVAASIVASRSGRWN
jgi:16S rRNA (uracil1498-N3)-methyltransferase